MVANANDRDSGVALDLTRLLGFKRVAVNAGNAATLTRALGATYNKEGSETPPPGPRLASALGATYTKAGEPLR